ncbi:MAG TPA: nucleoside triphosphate pyrophosphohydrolase [Desulfomicrobiaceae bacterium]|nr:nucleoside triphosphate pyrophosphohydrolase [Desulfomicrobiaceae bacterium]
MKTTESLRDLRQVIDTLLGPDGCSWDKEQTPRSLCDYLIEECFELVDAIRSENSAEVVEELGDVFFLLLFISRLYKESHGVTLSGVLDENAAKMIRRHPHVFDSVTFADQEELLANWEKIKREEKKETGSAPKGTFDSLPASLPPLLRAYRINSKAARVGFTWPDNKAQEEKLAEEWQEWLQARAEGDQARMEEEFGDYLFTLTEYGRRNGIKANSSLHGANRKFLGRFERMEQLARSRGMDFQELSMEEMDRLWDECKKEGA